ncbi:MAG: sigma-70 family RNA polymerase sigma factor [Lachnospiraceae bacterium]|nr:sigma-70 family RNA polymerase sigma factor [Lachnospiraceae bacterium]
MPKEITTEDYRILQLFRSGSEDAIREIQRVYGGYLFTLAEGILKDRQDAEECVNDTYLRAWESIPKAEPDNLKAYLSRVVRNLSISRLRSNQAKKRGGDKTFTSYEELSECIPDSRRNEQADRERLRSQMNSFLRNLSKEKRQIFLKRYWLSCSVAEIAAQLGKDERFVSNRLYEIKKKLRKHLEGCI